MSLNWRIYPYVICILCSVSSCQSRSSLNFTRHPNWELMNSVARINRVYKSNYTHGSKNRQDLFHLMIKYILVWRALRSSTPARVRENRLSRRGQNEKMLWKQRIGKKWRRTMKRSCRRSCPERAILVVENLSPSNNWYFISITYEYIVWLFTAAHFANVCLTDRWGLLKARRIWSLFSLLLNNVLIFWL